MPSRCSGPADFSIADSRAACSPDSPARPARQGRAVPVTVSRPVAEGVVVVAPGGHAGCVAVAEVVAVLPVVAEAIAASRAVWRNSRQARAAARSQPAAIARRIRRRRGWTGRGFRRRLMLQALGDFVGPHQIDSHGLAMRGRPLTRHRDRGEQPHGRQPTEICRWAARARDALHSSNGRMRF